MNFHRRVALLVALFTVATPIAALVVQPLVLGRPPEDQMMDRATGAAESISVRLRDGLYERVRDLQFAATKSAFQTSDTAAIRGELDEVRSSLPGYAWLSFVNARGQIVASTRNSLEGTDASKAEWFRDQPERVHVQSEPDTEESSGHVSPGGADILTLAVPVMGENKDPSGTLVAHIRLTWVEQLLAPMDTFAGAKAPQILVLNENGAALFGTTEATPAAQLITDWGGLSQRAQVLHTPQADYLVALSRVGAYRDLPASGLSVVAIAALPVTGFEEMRNTLLLVTVLVGVGCALVALFVTSRLFRPLQSIAAAAKAIRRGDVNAGIPELTGTGDLAVVAGSLGALVRALHDREQELQSTNSDLERRIEQRTAEIRRANAVLERLAGTDALTALPNRHAMRARLATLLAADEDSTELLCMVMLDLDHFKVINDSRGHMAGDQVLCRVADTLRKWILPTDYVSRWGGEEFLIVLVGVSSRDALQRVEALVKSVEDDRTVLDDGTVIRVTVSAGLAFFLNTGVTFDELYASADEALYRAKALGRNRVEAHHRYNASSSDRELTAAA